MCTVIMTISTSLISGNFLNTPLFFLAFFLEMYDKYNKHSILMKENGFCFIYFFKLAN